LSKNKALARIFGPKYMDAEIWKKFIQNVQNLTEISKNKVLARICGPKYIDAEIWKNLQKVVHDRPL
jgi:hypothetical protein